VLAPNYAQAHYSYADTLHPDDSINEVKEAISLDPLSPLFHSGLAEALLAIGQFDDAVRQLKTVFELDPSSPLHTEPWARSIRRRAGIRKQSKSFRSNNGWEGTLSWDGLAMRTLAWGMRNGR